MSTALTGFSTIELQNEGVVKHENSGFTLNLNQGVLTDSLGNPVIDLSSSYPTQEEMTSAIASATGGSGVITANINNNIQTPTNIPGITLDKNSFSGTYAVERITDSETIVIPAGFSPSLAENLKNKITSGVIQAILSLGDGTYLIAGTFTSYAGDATKNALACIDLNGNLATTSFALNLKTVVGSIYTILKQDNGQILLAGNITSYNSTTRQGIIRLNANGTEDSTFGANATTGASSNIIRLALFTDGKIAVNTSSSSSKGYIYVLNSDGTAYTTFDTNIGTKPNGSLSSIAIINNKLVLGGSSNFTTVSGKSVNKFAVINSNGTFDTTAATNIGTGPTGVNYVVSISALATVVLSGVQKLLVGGDFINWNGASSRFLVALNNDFTVYTALNNNLPRFFDPNKTFNLTKISRIIQRPDNKIWLIGEMPDNTTKQSKRIRLLNIDGTEDTSFSDTFNISGSATSIEVAGANQYLIGGIVGVDTTNIGSLVGITPSLSIADTYGITPSSNPFSPLNSPLADVAIYNNKFYLAGNFTWFSGSSFNYFARISPTGFPDSSDNTYNSNLGSGPNTNNVRTVRINTSGQAHLCGPWTVWNGATVNGLVRLNADGTRDTAFTTAVGTASTSINAITIDSSNRILLAGSFTTFNGVARNRMVVLQSSGALDSTATTNLGTALTDGSVYKTKIRPDGKFLIIGSFGAFNGTLLNNVALLNSTYTPDTTFNGNIGTGPNSSVQDAVVLPNNECIIYGDFTAYKGVACSPFYKLNADGTPNTTFNSNISTKIQGSIGYAYQNSEGRFVLFAARHMFALNGMLTYEGTLTTPVLVLNSDGTFYSSGYADGYNFGFNSAISGSHQLANGNTLLYGSMSTFSKIYSNGMALLSTQPSTGETIQGVKVSEIGEIYGLKDLTSGVWTVQNSRKMGTDTGVLFSGENTNLKYTSTNLQGTPLTQKVSFSLNKM